MVANAHWKYLNNSEGKQKDRKTADCRLYLSAAPS